MTATAHHATILTFLGATLLAVTSATACSDDSSEPAEICLDPRGCPDPDGADEVGDGDGDHDEYQFCTVAAGNGERTVHQCEGHLRVSLEFQTLRGNCARTLGDPEWCKESHEFGIGFDSYDQPTVMACCDAIATPEQDLLGHCAMDLVEQVCRSIPLRLADLLNSGQVKFVEQQARNLLAWLNANQQECYEALHQPAGTPGVLNPIAWKVNGGENRGWRALDNFTVKLEAAVIDSAWLPESPSEHIACEDTRLNNTEIFEEPGPRVPPRNVDGYQLGDMAAVAIRGPAIPGAAGAHGSATVASQAFCAGSRCSSLQISQDDSGGFRLDELDLFAQGATSVAVGDLPIQVDDLSLRLYGVSEGRSFTGATSGFVIGAGGAMFIVSGSFGASIGVRPATNATPITLHMSDRGWTIDSFTVQYGDASGTWSAIVPPSTWQ